jgi:hypothetical protein
LRLFTWKSDVNADRAPVRAGDVLKLQGFGCWGGGVCTKDIKATFTIKSRDCRAYSASRWSGQIHVNADISEEKLDVAAPSLKTMDQQRSLPPRSSY